MLSVRLNSFRACTPEQVNLSIFYKCNISKGKNLKNNRVGNLQMDSKASIISFYFLPTVAFKKAYLKLYLYMKIIRPLAFL
jgi:hypothetical protein